MIQVFSPLLKNSPKKQARQAFHRYTWNSYASPALLITEGLYNAIIAEVQEIANMLNKTTCILKAEQLMRNQNNHQLKDIETPAYNPP